MAKVKFSKRRVKAYDLFQEVYDISNARAHLYPNDKGLTAYRKPNRPISFSMGVGNFALVDNISGVQDVTSYWFANENPEVKGYVGAILCFKGKLKLTSTFTVLFVLTNGTLIHDLRERSWTDSHLTDMMDRLEFEYESVMHPKMLARHKKFINLIEGDDLDKVVFTPATGSRVLLEEEVKEERDELEVHSYNTTRAETIRDMLEVYASVPPRVLAAGSFDRLVTEEAPVEDVIEQPVEEPTILQSNLEFILLPEIDTLPSTRKHVRPVETVDVDLNELKAQNADYKEREVKLLDEIKTLKVREQAMLAKLEVIHKLLSN